MMRSILVAYVAFAWRALADCPRAMLQDAAASYIHAQSAGLANSAMLALASTITYAENDTPMDIKTGVLSQAIKIDFNRSLYDTTECAIFTELVAAANKKPYVIHTRMLLINNTINTIQSVATTDGDWAFNATSQLYYNTLENWSPIPVAKRDTRSVIQAAGDAYLDSWGDQSVKVPYGAPCARLEGGSYTAANRSMANTCTMGVFPEQFTITNRRYVVDEVVGAVDIFNDFPFIDTVKPKGTSSTNFIRVEGGLIRYIHEVTKCSTRNCGR